MIKVFKFGGASVKDALAVKNLAAIVHRYQDSKLLVVVSAMGKTTNAFEKLLAFHFQQSKLSFEALDEILAYHTQIMKGLFQDTSHKVFQDVDLLFDEIKHILHSPPDSCYDRAYDALVSYGELISTAIINHFLVSQGLKSTLLDARSLVKTDSTNRDAVVDWEATTAAIEHTVSRLTSSFDILITQGFIGSDNEGKSVTLGREGSDYTAAIFGYALNAQDVTIWKDVPGLLNADPKFYKDAVKLDFITYSEAIELAYYGATIIHPKTIKPLENKGIPLYVKSFLDPDAVGTVVGLGTQTTQLPASFIFKTQQVLISISPRDFSFIAEKNLQSIFEVFSRYNLSINLMQNSAISFSVCVDDRLGKTAEVIAELQANYKVRYNKDLWLITIRHYNQETIDRMLEGKTVLLEQRSRSTVQYVVAIV
jgi:aspartate kinase